MADSFRTEVEVEIKANRLSFDQFKTKIASEIADEIDRKVSRQMKRMQKSGLFDPRFIEGFAAGKGVEGAQSSGMMGRAGAFTAKAGNVASKIAIMAGGIGVIAGILMALFPPLRVFLDMFKLIGALLFIPLIPILKPLMMKLAEWIPKMADFMKDLTPDNKAETTLMGTAGLVGLIGGGIVGFAAGGPLGAVVGALLGGVIFPLITAALVKFGEFLGSKAQELWERIKNAWKDYYEIAATIWTKIENAWMTFKGMISGWGEKIGSAWDSFKDKIVSVGEKIENAFIDIVNKIISLMNKLPGVNMQTIGKSGGKSGSSSKATTGGPFSGPGGGDRMRELFEARLRQSQRGDDFVVTKGGQIIRANPEDTIIATKGGMGSTININISNPRFNDERDMNELIRKISRELQTQYRGRASQYGGI